MKSRKFGKGFTTISTAYHEKFPQKSSPHMPSRAGFSFYAERGICHNEKTGKVL